MSRRIGTMVQKSTGIQVPVYEGWSWPCFFFGSFWYLVKGMWGIGLFWLVLSVLTGSLLHFIGILVLSTKANQQFREHLGARGYEMQEPTQDPRDLSNIATQDRKVSYVAFISVALVAWAVVDVISRLR